MPPFAEIVVQNAHKIYRLALKMVGNQQDAEDIVQETFIKAMQIIDQFEGRSKVSTWLYRIAVNESLMFLRKQKKTVIDSDIESLTENGNYHPGQIVDGCCLPERELMNCEVKNNYTIQFKPCQMPIELLFWLCKQIDKKSNYPRKPVSDYLLN